MNKKYPDKLRLEIIEIFKNGESPDNISKRYNIPESTLYRWTHEYHQYLIVNGEKHYPADIALLHREMSRLKMELELLHKSKCAVQAPLSEKLPEMIRLKEETKCDIHTLCRAFEVLRSTYYHRVLRSPQKTQLQQEDEVLQPIIKEIFMQSKERFGSTMIKAKLDALGYQVSPKRIARLMKEMDLRCNRTKQTLPDYKRQYHKSIYYTGNKLNRKFLQLEPNHAWVSDITYLRTLKGIFYLCVIIDLFSRKVVGYSISQIEDTSMLITSLNMALACRCIKPGLIFHSDQGCQYTCAEFQDTLKAHDIVQSFSNVGSPYDNAVAESFFASLKKDQLYRNIYEDGSAVTAAVHEYIQFYNVDRPHYTLGMLTPCQIEEQYSVSIKK